MNAIDSSGWLEYFADGSNAPFFSRPLQKTGDLVAPTITIYEVFKVVLRQRNESDALQAVALMQQGILRQVYLFWQLRSASISACPWQTASFSLPPVHTGRPYGLRIPTSKQSMEFSILQKKTDNQFIHRTRNGNMLVSSARPRSRRR